MTSLPVSLPDGFVNVVDEGTTIIVGQVIASNKGPFDKIINIPKVLGVNRIQAKKIITKIPGELVNVGDVIAVKKGFFGTQKIILRSKVAGTVTRFERETGNLVIKTSVTVSKKDIISPVDGIIAMCDNREIVINTDKNVVIGELAQGSEVTGEIHVLQADDPYYLTANAIGKIAVSKNFTKDMISKSVGIGVAGIIGVGINDRDIDHLAEKKFQMPIIKISEQNYDSIKHWNGKKVFINPGSKSIIFLQL